MTVMWRKWSGYRRVLLAKGSAVYAQVVVHASRVRAFKAWTVSFERARRLYTSRLVRFKMAKRLHVLRGCLRRWKAFLRAQDLERDIDTRVDCAWAQVQSWLK